MVFRFSLCVSSKSPRNLSLGKVSSSSFFTVPYVEKNLGNCFFSFGFLFYATGKALQKVEENLPSGAFVNAKKPESEFLLISMNVHKESERLPVLTSLYPFCVRFEEV